MPTLKEISELLQLILRDAEDQHASSQGEDDAWLLHHKVLPGIRQIVLMIETYEEGVIR